MDAGLNNALIRLHAHSWFLSGFIFRLHANHHHDYTISPKKKAAGFWLPTAFIMFRFRTNLWADLSIRLNNNSSSILSACLDRFPSVDS
jgi:hypothetical protein